MLFREVIGQEAVKQRLLNTVKENRVSHAQLFLGASGSGTLPLAIAYAQYVSCTNKQENDSCNTCHSCIKYNKLVHPDLHFVYPIALSKDSRVSTDVISKWRSAFLDNPYMSLGDWFDYLDAENKQATIGTDESTEILRKLSLTTYEAEYKIMVIWMADKMNQSAANKLLKILEEPPDKTLFLLIVEQEDQLLRTILSRTQLVKVYKLSDAELKQALIDNKRVSEEDASRIVHLADGDYNAAIKLLSENENAAFNLSMFQQWMRACLKLDFPKMMAWGDEMASIGREKQKNFMLYALHILRESLMLSYGSGLVKLEGEELDFVKKFSPFIHGGNCTQMIEELNRAYSHIERNANPKILFLDLSFRMHELLSIKAAVKQ
jgi:DNA polymerase-3 subunit delta'